MKPFAKHLVVASTVLLSAGDARAILIDFEGLSSMTYLGPPEKAATTAGQQRWLIASL